MIAALSINDIFALLPFWIILGGCITFLGMVFFEKPTQTNNLYFWVATLFLGAAAVVIYMGPETKNPLLLRWITFDPLSRYFSHLFLIIGFSVSLIALNLPPKICRGEFYFFLFSCLIGLLLISAAADFLPLFLGLEILSISLYILTAFSKRDPHSAEAGIKYFFLGSLSTAILLFGIALLYGSLGTTQISSLSKGLLEISGDDRLFYLVGIFFVFVGLSFKAALAPFHQWAPDVYEGSTTPVVAFMATGTKVGAFAAFARIFLGSVGDFSPLWEIGALLIIIPSILVAHLGALRQQSLHRFFGYTGISHSSFMMLAILAQNVTGLFYYSLFYSMATLGFFSIASSIKKTNGTLLLEDLEGLYYRNPRAALFTAFFLVSLAGLPLTAGFLGKFFLIYGALQQGFFFIAAVALVGALLAAYYYLRITLSLFVKEDKSKEPTPIPAYFAAASALILGIMTLFPQIISAF